MLLADVDHSGHSVLIAVCRCLAALHIERRGFRAGVIQTVLLADVDHSGLSVLIAVCRCLAALYIERRGFRAGVV